MLISFENIKIHLSGKTILHDLSFGVETGSKIVITGKSGSGKSSILNTLTGFIRPTAGSIKFKGVQLTGSNIIELRKLSAYLPQQINFNTYTVESFIKLPFDFGINKLLTPDREKTLSYFSAFDLDNKLLDSRMQDISGGEKQRIALISCLLLKRPILLLDEPTSALDTNSKNRVMDFLFNNDETTIVSASHDPDWIERCDEVIDLKA